MTWRTFAVAIQDAQITGGVPYKIIGDIFKAAGCPAGPSEQAIRTWLEQKRNCDGSRYFPDKEIDAQKLFVIIVISQPTPRYSPV